MPYVLTVEPSRKRTLHELLAPYQGVTREGFVPAPTQRLLRRIARSRPGLPSQAGA